MSPLSIPLTREPTDTTMNARVDTPCEGFSNEVTLLVAQVLSNDRATWDRLRPHFHGQRYVEADAVRSLLEGRVARRPADFGLQGRDDARLAEVNWQEISEVFDAAIDPGPQLVAEPKAKPIDLEVLNVLAAGRTEDNRFYLPPRQLDRKLYERVNKILVDLGGKWKGGKTAAHVFDGPADEAMAAALATGEIVTPKDFGFFPTPDAIARRVIEMAGLEPGMQVLEPSAGVGSLALPAAEIVGIDNMHLVELLPRNAERLRQAGFTHVHEGDFLQLRPEPRYDRIVANPPFGKMQDMAHVAHMARFLKPDGELVAIMSPSFQFRDAARAEDFRRLVDMAASAVEPIEAGAFRQSGTDIATVIVHIEAARLPWNVAPRQGARQRG